MQHHRDRHKTPEAAQCTFEELQGQGAYSRGHGQRAAMRSPARHNEKWGPALLPAPICAERRIRRCSSAFETRRFPALRSWLTSSGVASGRRSQSEDGFHFLPRPFLDQSPFASPASRGTPRFAQERLALPAPLPTGPIRSRSFSSSPAGGDRTFRPFLILPVVADAPGRLGLSSRSPISYEPRPESCKVESAARSLWIMGISRITVRTIFFVPLHVKKVVLSRPGTCSSITLPRSPNRLSTTPRPG